MRGIERSTDPGVRPSPSISATVYPRGHRERGNDGNTWEIIVDSRGTHRWKKVSDMGSTPKSADVRFEQMSGVETRTKKQIEGAQLLIQDDPSSKESIFEIFESKLKELERQYDLTGDYGDEKYGKAAIMVRNFLRKTYREGGVTESRRRLFESALESGHNYGDSREHIKKRLNEI